MALSDALAIPDAAQDGEIDPMDVMRRLLAQQASQIVIRDVPANFAEYGEFPDPNEPAVDCASYGEPAAAQQPEQPVIAPAPPPQRSPGFASFLGQKAAEMIGETLQILKRFACSGGCRG
jgi:hypothetical protein